MSDDITGVKIKIQEHDMKLEAMSRLMTESIGEHRQLVKELHALTNKFGIYIERHDQVSESNKRLWVQQQMQDADIHKLQQVIATNQPIIEGLRTLNGKLLWLVLSAVISPAAIGVALLLHAKAG